MKRINKCIERLTDIFNVIAVAAIVLLMLLVCANVVMRYVFKTPSPAPMS